jgi:hypothetical protein
MVLGVQHEFAIVLNKNRQVRPLQSRIGNLGHKYEFHESCRVYAHARPDKLLSDDQPGGSRTFTHVLRILHDFITK